MTKKAILNAVLAELYIIALVWVMDNVIMETGLEDVILIPIMMLSLFVLSAAVMGYLFVYEPGRRYLDGEKKEAVELFLKTVGIFAIIAAIILSILVSSA